MALCFLPTGAPRILELGCGTGILTEQMLKACPGASVTGIDISPEMLDTARKKPHLSGASFVACDIRRAWPGRNYDAVVTSLCLHHVSPREREQIIGRAVRNLKPGGRFICGDIFRAEEDWEEEILTRVWEQSMRDAGASEAVVTGMLAQRIRRLPKLSTIPWFRDRCRSAGFARIMVPYQAGFVGLVVACTPAGAGPGDTRNAGNRPGSPDQ
jgi:ubiquinone/menaquinone biosynthesis C-methylase UbiE